MFIQIKTYDENASEQSVNHFNTAQMSIIQFAKGDTSASFTVGPDTFITKDSDSIQRLRTFLQTAIDIRSRILAYEAQDAALGAMR